MNKLLLTLAFFASFCALNADTVKLKNGDKISGTLSIPQLNDQTLTKVALTTVYGTIEISKVDIDSVLSTEEAQKDADATAKNDAETKARAAESTQPVVRTWVDDYKDYVHSAVPSGWEFKISGGMEWKETTTKTTSYAIAFEGYKKFDAFNEFKFNMWYEYATEQPQGLPEYKSTDKYGVMTNYKRFLTSGDSWFLQNMLGYSVDMIKGIEDQVDEGILFGRKFKFLDDKFIMNIAAGPAVRYTNARNYDDHWALLATLTEDIVYRFHEHARFEQNMYYGQNVTNIHSYSFAFMAAVIFEITDVMHLLAKYTYSYDTMTADTAQKEEQRFILGFEIPLK